MSSRRALLLCCGWWLAGATLPAATDLAGARQLYATQRYAEAQAAFEQLAADEPTNAVAHQFLGKLARKRQDLEAALSHMERARELAPADPAIVFDYGATSSLLADTQGMSFKAVTSARRGRAALEEAVSLDPANIDYRQALLEFHASAPGIVGGSLAKAYEQADAIAAIDARRGAYARGNLHVQAERYQEALALWRELLASTPDDYWLLLQLGRTASLSGLEAGAGIAALEKCLTLPRPENAPGPSRVQWHLGNLYRETGDNSAAHRALRAALEIEPLNREIARDLARLPPPESP